MCNTLMHNLENRDIFNLKEDEQILLPILKKNDNLKIFVFNMSLQNY